MNPVTMVFLDPVAKGRPRMTRRGIVYTPAATRFYETRARAVAARAMGNNPVIAGPVRIVALVEIVPPKSWSKARTAAAIVGDIKPTSRPDLDNYLKAALDAINGVVFADDSLVIELTAKKTFGLHSKLVLTVLPLAALSSNARAL